METKLIRLNKALADAGICSRRHADELIFNAKVRVNGEIIDNPAYKVDVNQDHVECEGEKVLFSPHKQHCYLALHKPIEVVSTAKDPQGRQTVLDLLPPAWKNRRLYPVGRLDYFSEGLILLTDDGDFTHRLTHPRWQLPRVYEVWVRPNYGHYDLGKALHYMRRGMTLEEGERVEPVQVHVLEGGDAYDPDPQYRVSRGDNRLLLEITLFQGLNRQIRRMCRDLDLTVLRLTRIAHANIELGGLPIGKTRELSSREIQELRKAVGL